MMPLRQLAETAVTPVDSHVDATKMRQNGHILSRLGLVNRGRIDKMAHLPFGPVRVAADTKHPKWGLPGASTA
jgi:hypothetical protein